MLTVLAGVKRDRAHEARQVTEMERRKYPRVDVKFKVALAFAGGRTEGQGQMLNLSEGGCAVRGDKRVPEQATLHLRIYPPGRNTPVVIKNASVRWVRGSDFGVEFSSLSPEERAELHQLLQQIKAFISESPAGAAEKEHA